MKVEFDKLSDFQARNVDKESSTLQLNGLQVALLTKVAENA
jgi:hypothetical protein